ncbi:unnamed protein product [marine sediment metagenome]|uniref:Uncharacterized protein n=1 Tax=marine sediment metagenome TaxID=412755 RepID=X0XJ92_9ZZZZ
MGGKVKDGYAIISGVVEDEVKDCFDKLVSEGIFRSRCHAIGFILTEFAKNHQKTIENNFHDA